MDKLALTCLIAAVCALVSCSLNPQPEPPGGSRDITAEPPGLAGSGGSLGGMMSGTSTGGGILTGGSGGAGGPTGAGGTCGFCDVDASAADAATQRDGGGVDAASPDSGQPDDAPPSVDGTLDEAAPDTGTTVEGGDGGNPTEGGASETGPLGDGTDGDGASNF